ncbi:glycosyltransferase [Rhodoferax sp. WC2427]|uniref:glycosyltransferase n=1 Tax=Rhodoferax sp. WC2427 TaxID=3234144 RepID=UPI0034653161
MDNPKILELKLSVLLVTYNHENYIERALDSLFRQKLSHRIELVIADDFSSDKTIEIIKSFEGRDDRFIFKYLDNDKNYGITRNYQRGFLASDGLYVAVLEGDDYWISPTKLEKQILFLDEHWECDLCSVNYWVFEENRNFFYPRAPIGNDHKIIAARDLINDNLVGNFSTCMYRKSALRKIPQSVFEIKSYDWIINICISGKNLIGFLNEPLSVYRIHSKGSWSKASHLEKLKAQLEIIPAYNDLTDGIYNAEFNELSARIKNSIAIETIDKNLSNIKLPASRLFRLARNFLPPFLFPLFHLITPPIFSRVLLKIIRRGGK